MPKLQAHEISRVLPGFDRKANRSGFRSPGSFIYFSLMAALGVASLVLLAIVIVTPGHGPWSL